MAKGRCERRSATRSDELEVTGIGFDVASLGCEYVMRPIALVALGHKTLG